MDYRSDPNRTYSYPGREDESWAASLIEYPGGGLELATVAHQQELMATGWRLRGETWSRSTQRRSVEQAGETLRPLVQRLDCRNPPPHTLGPVVGVAVGIAGALVDLLFHPTAAEAWAAGEVALRDLGGGKNREKEDPLRARFGSAAAALTRAEEPVSQRALGAGAQSYAVAESKGRTRARWDEVHCQASHVGSGSIKGLYAVEAAVDAQRSIAGAGIAALELASLRDWLEEKVKPEERIRRYRQRVAVQRGHGVGGIVSDAGAREATTDVTDRAILSQLTRARATLDRHLAKLPARAEALAAETGDTSFLAPIVQRRPEREKRKAPPRRPVEPIESCAVGAW
jgi:hypothetical protein